ncbi:MAG TPA: tRNA (adenosine(37)-N6)-threonylcarbamoyltransferase complex dimerization subunit type 1 TsaB [Acidobacteriaceae bacterium]|jgi:tRNA threonylcarbamoyladenosine biosynthesis protein TsaB|nr:tRNA (adenosine(37)-N6)-threonylcarbamoyltransferase complex dimerization subunit type 1 TsaB [Acidobacteriaceae bacterium]
MLLSIDTCGSLGTVALVRPENDEPVVLGQTELAGKTYAAQLVPAVRELLLAHNVRPSQIVTIVVTKGPGSFTGIRIGLSTAKGLAEAGHIPIVAVSRLAVLAYKGRTTAAALDASRGEFYLGDFSSAPTERLLARDHFLERAALLAEYLAVCEDVVHAAAPESTVVEPPTAADALRFALPRLRAGDYDDPVILDGNYLRRSDAEIFAKPKLAATS